MRISDWSSDVCSSVLVTDETNIGVAGDLAVKDHTAGNGAYLGNLEYIPYLQVTNDLFFELRSQESFHSRLDFFDSLIDYRIETDIDLFLFRTTPGVRGRKHLEAQDN